MTMTGKERAELRSECNRLRPTVHVGNEGLSNALTEALDDALRTRELVKVQLNPAADVSAKDAARQLAGLSLLPAIRLASDAPDATVVADGTSC